MLNIEQLKIQLDQKRTKTGRKKISRGFVNRNYSDEESEFLKVVDLFRQVNNCYPGAIDYLFIAKILGYERTKLKK